ncbi:recombinase family protein [Ruminococcus albus]|uniref:Resolvase domain n=1 Tax=Ruminococcus albus (strain ATCC 27210 / DSM 20455 / JCM 14654 / NCDO 2250 / 7) TaxID=697329 RepID=E6UL65_RUMA7|nr:recombinase family protein [Ruminococcus albus]ADU24411.1 Resolvase domain [Ruminococcus albus 7 = DSM 20455]
MQRIFGYCRISRPTQNIERQERNIIKSYPTARIYKEAYTGTKTSGRKELEKLLKQVQSGDMIVFDSVSRMSRNAAEGVELYLQLYEQGVELVFLKEPHINTSTYKQALSRDVPMIGEDVDLILQGVNAYLKRLAVRQIELAFGQAQKEVDDLHQRTAEGIETARRNGKQIGQRKGATLNVKKAAAAKKIIRTSCKTFGGTLTDEQCAAAAGICRKTYYKYKAELRREFEAEGLQMTLDEVSGQAPQGTKDTNAL